MNEYKGDAFEDFGRTEMFDALKVSLALGTYLPCKQAQTIRVSHVKLWDVCPTPLRAVLIVSAFQAARVNCHLRYGWGVDSSTGSFVKIESGGPKRHPTDWTR